MLRLHGEGRFGAGKRELHRLRTDFEMESEALFRRAVWRVARRITPVIAVDQDGMRLFVSTADQTLGRRLFCYRRVDQEDIELAFSVLRALPGVGATLDGCRVVEIGANIGSHTVELLKRYGATTVIGIEPDPGNFALLRQNVLANDVADRATLLQLALSDVDGVLQLELSDRNSGDHRVRVQSETVGGPESRRETIDVRAARFDSLVESDELDLETTGLVWMDAQGHEAHILRGAEHLLGSRIPIVMEYWPYGLRRAGGIDDLHELIASHYAYVIDLNTPSEAPPRVIAASDLPLLARRYQAHDHGGPASDLILAPDIDAGLRLPCT